MPYTTSTIAAGELMRQFNETCTFRKSFHNYGLSRTEMFINFLRTLNFSYTIIENHSDMSVIEITCRTSERHFVDEAAEILNREPNERMSSDWRRHYMQRMVNDAETRFTQEYLSRSPSEITETPQHINTLVEERI